MDQGVADIYGRKKYLERSTELISVDGVGVVLHDIKWDRALSFEEAKEILQDWKDRNRPEDTEEEQVAAVKEDEEEEKWRKRRGNEEKEKWIENPELDDDERVTGFFQ